MQYDLVTSIEVLEHIEDDQPAAAAMAGLSRMFVYILVPFCSQADLEHPGVRARLLERFGHHRPGYTRETLTSTFAGAEALWMRNCYYQPEATELRNALQEATANELAADRERWLRRAVDDIRDTPVERRQAAGGIEALFAVEH
jgi:hypothetical protein